MSADARIDQNPNGDWRGMADPMLRTMVVGSSLFEVMEVLHKYNGKPYNWYMDDGGLVGYDVPRPDLAFQKVPVESIPPSAECPRCGSTLRSTRKLVDFNNSFTVVCNDPWHDVVGG